MTARETIQTKLHTLHSVPRSASRLLPARSALSLCAEGMIHLLLAAVLANVSVLDGRSPFALALVAASGSGLCGGCALLGACFGYLSLLDFSSALRYSSAVILVFALSFAFYDWTILRKRWSMPLVAAAVNGFTGFLIQSQQGWSPSDTVEFVLELGLTAAAAWCYQRVLAPLRRHRVDRLRSGVHPSGLLVLSATILMALLPLRLHREISPAPALAAALMLTVARQCGPSAGGITGLFLGAALDLAGTGTPLYTMAWGLSGLAGGMGRGKRRLRTLLAYLPVNAACLLWTWSQNPPIGPLYEGLLGGLIFLLLPETLLRRTGLWLAPELSGPVDMQAQRLVRQKLESTAQAFSTLCDSLKTAFRAPDNDNDVADVFDRAANRVCRSCPLRMKCWQQDYTGTFNALNDATPAMVERGRALPGDFPSHFSTRCIHFSAFLGAVNEELSALFYRRQYNARIRESRRAVCRQYAQLSELLGEAAAELSRELTPDLLGDRKLRARMAELGLEVRTAVFRDSRGLLRVEAEGPACGELSRPTRLSELSALLGAPLRVEQAEDNTLSLLQQEPLMAVAGVAAQKKNGETVSGDAGTYFKRPDGKLYVLLCDGMGSGPEANRESSLALRLLEQFLQAGVAADRALTTLASALALRGEETGGFTTVDLLQVDLFTGESLLYKLGAAPTYVKTAQGVRRLAGTSLPAGLAEGRTDALDRFSLSLSPGDTVLMISDGICGTGPEDWLRDRLARFDGDSPKDLARALITDSPQTATDDRTALVIRLETRT